MIHDLGHFQPIFDCLEILRTDPLIKFEEMLKIYRVDRISRVTELGVMISKASLSIIHHNMPTVPSIIRCRNALGSL